MRAKQASNSEAAMKFNALRIFRFARSFFLRICLWCRVSRGVPSSGSDCDRREETKEEEEALLCEEELACGAVETVGPISASLAATTGRAELLEVDAVAASSYAGGGCCQS